MHFNNRVHQIFISNLKTISKASILRPSLLWFTPKHHFNFRGSQGYYCDANCSSQVSPAHQRMAQSNVQRSSNRYHRFEIAEYFQGDKHLPHRFNARGINRWCDYRLCRSVSDLSTTHSICGREQRAESEFPRLKDDTGDQNRHLCCAQSSCALSEVDRMAWKFYKWHKAQRNWLQRHTFSSTQPNGFRQQFQRQCVNLLTKSSEAAATIIFCSYRPLEIDSDSSVEEFEDALLNADEDIFSEPPPQNRLKYLSKHA